jgi:hypothetical protein
MKQPFRIPVEQDYSAAGELIDMEFSTQGGAWSAYFTESTINTDTNNDILLFFENMWATAQLVEPVCDDDLRPEDVLYRTADAFRAGMYTGELLSEQLYAGTMDYPQIHNKLNKLLPFSSYEGKEQYEANGEYLKRLGSHGLSIAGYDIRRLLEQWGSDIVEEPSIRPIYSLGAGAILTVYHETYTFLHPVLMQNYHVSQILNFDELDEFLSSNTDSSGN